MVVELVLKMLFHKLVILPPSCVVWKAIIAPEGIEISNAPESDPCSKTVTRAGLPCGITPTSELVVKMISEVVRDLSSCVM